MENNREAMGNKVEKRRAFLINAAYFTVILAVFYLVFKTFFGMLVPFIVAFSVAAAVNRPVSYLEKKTPIKRGIISTVFIIVIVGMIAGILFLLGIQAYEKLRGFSQLVLLKMQNLSQVLDEVKTFILSAFSFLPQKLQVSVEQGLTEFFNKFTQSGENTFHISDLGLDWSSLLTRGGGVIKDTVVQIPGVLIAVVITVVASVFISTDYEHIKSFFLLQFSERNKNRIRTAKTVALTTFKNMFKAYFFILLITATEIFTGLEILKLFKIFSSDYILIISLIIAVIDIIPVLGTGTVLIPWAVYSFITGNYSMGIGLIVLYAVVTVIRQIVEPKFVAGQAGLSPVVTIAAMYIGTKTIGVLGFFILPFLVILMKKFNDEGIIHLFKTASAENADKNEEQAVILAQNSEAIRETDKKSNES